MSFKRFSVSDVTNEESLKPSFPLISQSKRKSCTLLKTFQLKSDQEARLTSATTCIGTHRGKSCWDHHNNISHRWIRSSRQRRRRFPVWGRRSRPRRRLQRRSNCCTWRSCCNHEGTKKGKRGKQHVRSSYDWLRGEEHPSIARVEQSALRLSYSLRCLLVNEHEARDGGGKLWASRALQPPPPLSPSLPHYTQTRAHGLV